VLHQIRQSALINRLFLFTGYGIAVKKVHLLQFFAKE